MKELGGCCKGGSKIPATVVDGAGVEKVRGDEVLKVWGEAFRLLGEDDLNDEDFDREFAEEVEKEVTEMEDRTNTERKIEKKTERKHTD